MNNKMCRNLDLINEPRTITNNDEPLSIRGMDEICSTFKFAMIPSEGKKYKEKERRTREERDQKIKCKGLKL